MCYVRVHCVLGAGWIVSWRLVGPCHVVSFCIVSGRFVSCRVVSCHVVSRRVVSCRVVSCRVVSCRVASCRVVLCRVVSCRVVQECVLTLLCRVNMHAGTKFEPPPLRHLLRLSWLRPFSSSRWWRMNFVVTVT